MDFIIKVSDNYDEDCRCQEAWSENEDIKMEFSVCDLFRCPEDAIIGRDLFTVDDFIETLMLGFKIAKLGYNDIVVEEVVWGDN